MKMQDRPTSRLWQNEIAGAAVASLYSLPQTGKAPGTAYLLERALILLESRLGRHPTAEEIAATLGADIKTYGVILEELYPLPIFAARKFPDVTRAVLCGRGSDGQDDFTLTGSFIIEVLALGIESLPAEERQVVALRHQQKLAPEEVARVLLLPVSGVRQLHTQAILRLRAALTRACAS